MYNMDNILLHEFRNSLIEKNYFRPIMKILKYHNNTHDCHYITKQFLIETLFHDLSKKRQQKILKKAKKLNVWNIDNDIFEPIITTYCTCRKECQHQLSEYTNDFSDCYYNNVEFKREFIKLKLQNIHDKIKDEKYNFYWINQKVLTSLIDIFIIVISRPHSTIGFTDRTPIHLLPSQYFPLKWMSKK